MLHAKCAFKTLHLHMHLNRHTDIIEFHQTKYKGISSFTVANKEKALLVAQSRITIMSNKVLDSRHTRHF